MDILTSPDSHIVFIVFPYIIRWWGGQVELFALFGQPVKLRVDLGQAVDKKEGRETMEQVTLRQATVDDSDFVYAVKKDVLDSYVDQIYGWREWEQWALHQRRFRPAETQIIVRDDEEIGVLTIHRERDCIHVRQLFLLPHTQSRGIGSYLMRGILAEAGVENLPVALQVLKTNPRAVVFYQRLGFKVVGETDTHHQMEYDPHRSPAGDIQQGAL